MSKDFEFKMERQEGGNPVTLSVTESSVKLAIDPPVKQNEEEAVKGLAELAKALKRDLEPNQGGDTPNLSIKTGDRDPALAVVIAQALEAHGVLKTGEAKKFEVAIDKADHAQQQEVAKSAPEYSTAAQLASIRAAMSGTVTPSDMPERPVATEALPAREQSQGNARNV